MLNYILFDMTPRADMWISSSLLFLCVGFSYSQNGAPPADEDCALNFDSPVYMCPDEDSLSLADTSDVEVRRHNETSSYMAGFIEVLKEITSCTVMELIVEKTQGARTEVMMTHDICDLCAELNPESSYHKYLKPFKFPECPFGPGRYEIENFVPDAEDLPLKKVNEARYKATINLYDNPSCDCKEKTPLGCMLCEFVIEEIEEI